MMGGRPGPPGSYPDPKIPPAGGEDHPSLPPGSLPQACPLRLVSGFHGFAKGGFAAVNAFEDGSCFAALAAFGGG